jgi:BirA family biotin operon repressor/biotin-[acetyl-CoA-carboxylase] ligase
MNEPTAFSIPEFNSLLTTKAIGRDFRYNEQVGSTMDLARGAASDGASHGTLFFAEEQTAGRGRRGRSFYSPARLNLYFTLILRCPMEVHRRLPVLVPAAVCGAIADQGLESAIKWPNDIWVGGRKVCGMLIDGEISPAGAVAMPGIGINVNGDPTEEPELARIATSVRRELGHGVSREALLARVCGNLEELLAAPFDDALAQYRALSCVLGRAVRVKPAAGDEFEATASSINDDGSLWVRRTDGRRELVTAADVSLRPSRAE